MAKGTDCAAASSSGTTNSLTRVCSAAKGAWLGRFGFGCGRSEGCARRGRFVRGVERGGGILVKADLRAHGRAFRLLEGESEGLVVTQRGVGGLGGGDGAATTAAGRAGRMHWSITTSASPGVPSQTMSPLRSGVEPVTRLSLTCRPWTLPASSMVKPSGPAVDLGVVRAHAGEVETKWHTAGSEPSSTSGPSPSSTKRVPASGPPRTVSEAFFSAIRDLFRLHPQGRMRLFISGKF